jgi:hypothetical protein
MAACSSEPQKPAENKPAAEAKPAFENTYVTGREALQKMYIAARSWSVDAKPFHLDSQPTKEANGQDGKSGLWQAGFASPSRREQKMFSWSGIKSDNAPEPGIASRPADTYNPANTYTQIFDIAFLKIESTDALKEANKHGGDKLLKKSPDTEIFYVVEWDGKKNKLFWRVLYGDNKNDPKLAVDVDASTGQFIKVER